MKRYPFRMGAPSLVVALLALSACGGGGSSAPSAPPPSSSSPPPAATNFTAFVRGQAAGGVSDDGLPIEIESIDWDFTGDDDETAYDDIIQPSI